MRIYYPLINGQSYSTYKANLVNYKVGTASLNNNYMFPVNSVFPVLLNGTVGTRKVSLTIDFEGEDQRDSAQNMSDLTALFKKGVDLFLPDGFFYRCVLSSVSDGVVKAPWIIQHTFNFVGFRHGNEIRETITESTNLLIEGNLDTRPVYTISTSESTFVIDGITINNISGTIVIDSPKGLITENGNNKFSDSNLTDFPVLSPGVHRFEISGNAVVQISYLPIFY